MKLPYQIDARVPDAVAEFPWTRAIGAASLVAGAYLLFSGRRKSALAVAAGGAVVALLENPETAKELWEKFPGYLRAGQDFLVRTEDFVEDLAKKGEKFRQAIAQQV